MTQNNDWFPQQNGSIPGARDIILQYVNNTPLCYSTEIAFELDLDPRTVSKWLKRLLIEGDIKRVDMSLPPTTEQSKRIKKFISEGMKPNHFKNARWYCCSRGDTDE